LREHRALWQKEKKEFEPSAGDRGSVKKGTDDQGFVGNVVIDTL
jgi:hypothetical protein